MDAYLEWYQTLEEMWHLCRFDTSWCPWYTCGNIDSDLCWSGVKCISYSWASWCIDCGLCGQLLWIKMVSMSEYWVLKLCFPWRISYADLDGSSHAILSILWEFPAWGKSWFHGWIGKFGSIKHKPLMKWFWMFELLFPQHWLYVHLVERIVNLWLYW